ncbi:MAG TPA: hypothetical protein ENJ28_06785 [Gammaproteobacteria bacterium]|nr:hypothetical protein [Gammaproteobacteria bacterium]
MKQTTVKGSNLNIHTLGPEGTNCEAAAANWLAENNINGNIILHNTLEDGIVSMQKDPKEAMLLGCVVYPDLHHLVFNNRHKSKLVECFVFPTMPMLLAARSNSFKYDIIATHPAPTALIPENFDERMYVNSNAVAAKKCADGIVDACITTEKSAKQHGLIIIEDFGQIPMGFTLHGRMDSDVSSIKSNSLYKA